MKHTRNSNMIILAIFVLVLGAALLFVGCNKNPAPEGPLYNGNSNDQLNNLTNLSGPALNTPACEEFMFQYADRPEAKYEAAEDDFISLSKGTVKSTEISVLGVMLGDSYDSLISKLGVPDVMYVPADKLSKNLEYRKKIGICELDGGVIFHLENDVVTRITLHKTFEKYLPANRTIGLTKEEAYTLLDTPDYQDFISIYRIFHYVDQGIELYFKGEHVRIFSLILPQEFKGVEYKTTQEIAQEGVVVNVTRPVPNE